MPPQQCVFAQAFILSVDVLKAYTAEQDPVSRRVVLAADFAEYLGCLLSF